MSELEWVWKAPTKLWLLVSICFVALALPACKAKETSPLGKEVEMLSLSSSAFGEGGRIPIKYTCDGQDVSPPLVWGELPAETQSFAFIMDDPDAPAGVFTHWVIFNIPADSRGLLEAVPAQPSLANGASQGKNDFGRIGYGGPCPPRGRPHHYQFTLYALTESLDLKAGVSKKQVLDAIKGHILAQGRLVGIYQR